MGSNLNSGLNVVVSALRGLASTGYFSQEQLRSMENILAKREEQGRQGKRWLTISEACHHAKICRTTLWKYCRSGQLAVHKLGRKRLIEQGELDALLLSF